MACTWPFPLSRSILLTLERGLESPLKQPHQLEESVTLRHPSGPQKDDNLPVVCRIVCKTLVPEEAKKEEKLE